MFHNIALSYLVAWLRVPLKVGMVPPGADEDDTVDIGVGNGTCGHP